MAQVRTSHLLIFTKQFASMLASNLHLAHVLENLAEETPHRGLREVVRDVVLQVKRGTDFSDALGHHPRVFNSVYVGIVRAGMESGRLAEALRQVAEYLEGANKIAVKMRAALAYPVTIGIAFIGLLNGMVLGILPRFEQLFSSFDKALPAPTQALLAFGDFYTANGLAFAMALGGAAAAVALWRATPQGRLKWDEIKIRLPLIGPLMRLASVARFTRTLAVQVGNSVPLVEALRFSAPASGNRYVERTVQAMARDIENGVGVTEAFRRRGVFSGVVLQMVASGEESARLDEMLLSAAGYYDSLLLQRIDTITSLINPVLTLLLGLAVAGLLIAAFLPVFDVSGVVG